MAKHLECTNCGRKMKIGEGCYKGYFYLDVFCSEECRNEYYDGGYKYITEEMVEELGYDETD